MARPKRQLEKTEDSDFIKSIKQAQEDIEYLEEAKKHFRESWIFQPIVYVKTLKKVGFRKNIVVELPVVCPLIFTSEGEAESYIPYFLKDISKNLFDKAPLTLKDPKNPKRILINEELVRATIKPLTLVQAFAEEGKDG